MCLDTATGKPRHQPNSRSPTSDGQGQRVWMATSLKVVWLCRSMPLAFSYELVFWKAQVVCPVELNERVLVRSCTINHAAVLIAWMSCHQGKKLELRIRCRSMQRSISSDRGPADEPIRRRISRSVSRHRASMIASTIQRRRLRRLRLADGAVASIEFFFPCERADAYRK